MGHCLRTTEQQQALRGGWQVGGNSIQGTDVRVDGQVLALPPEAQHVHGGVTPVPDGFQVTVPRPGSVLFVDSLSVRDFLFAYHIAKQEMGAERVKGCLQVYVRGELGYEFSLAGIDDWLKLDRTVSRRGTGAPDADSAVTVVPVLTINGEPVHAYTVKSNCFFAMGDNRDNSIDSRYYGFVSVLSLKGRAKWIYLSTDKQVPAYRVGSWIRWSRIGKPLR